MTALTETSTFEATITQIETTDPVVGGPGGVANRALIELTNRTRFLKDQVDAILADLADNYALQDGTYSLLRAQGTTKGDVGLGSVQNFPATSDPSDGSAAKYATAAAVKSVKDDLDGLEFGAQLADIGYQRLPSGMIFQWGDIEIDQTSAPQIVTFPLTFPERLTFFVATDRAGSFVAANNHIIGIDTPSIGVSSVGISATAFNGSFGTSGVYWFAGGF